MPLSVNLLLAPGRGYLRFDDRGTAEPAEPGAFAANIGARVVDSPSRPGNDLSQGPKVGAQKQKSTKHGIRDPQHKLKLLVSLNLKPIEHSGLPPRCDAICISAYLLRKQA